MSNTASCEADCTMADYTNKFLGVRRTLAGSIKTNVRKH